MFFKRCKSVNYPPALYGVAWVDYKTKEFICAPMPFNILVGLLRKFWFWMKGGITPAAYDGLPECQRQRVIIKTRATLRNLNMFGMVNAEDAEKKKRQILDNVSLETGIPKDDLI